MTNHEQIRLNALLAKWAGVKVGYEGSRMMNMKKLAWGVFWVYQVTGVLVAMYYWEEFVGAYVIMKQVVEGILL